MCSSVHAPNKDMKKGVETQATVSLPLGMKRKFERREGFQTGPKFKCQKEESQNTEPGVIRKLAHKGAKQTRDDACNRSPTQIHTARGEGWKERWAMNETASLVRGEEEHSPQCSSHNYTCLGGVGGIGGPSVHHWDNWHHSSSSAWAPLWKYYWQYHSQWLFGNKAILRRIWQSRLRESSDLRCFVNTARVETMLTHSTAHEVLHH